jgi:putative intracellular protease/amidase
VCGLGGGGPLGHYCGVRANVKFSSSSWELISPGVKSPKPFTVVDGDLYTGQNPGPAAPLATELLKVLN